MEFGKFFETATGFSPYPFQVSLADSGLPDVITAPTGSGKTEAVVIPWLWRSLHGSPDVRAETPRRLVIALPMRTLVEQSESRVRAILERLGLGDSVRLQVLMGGRLSHNQTSSWRTSPQERSIVIGTVDGVVSRALNRGYGSTRAAYPIDFGLITNGSHIVVDEVQLCIQATATLRQVSAFQRGWGTAEPVGLTCMSATVPKEALDVVDNPYQPEATRIVSLLEKDEQHPALAKRLDALRTVRQAAPCTKPKEIADKAKDVHVPGTLTIVMVNTVKRAVETFQTLRKTSDADLVLLHSRFRGVERADILERILSELPAGGRIVVSTQVLEAGVDLDARTLVTETAPWSSLVQRAGRCNRTGTHPGAQLVWFEALDSKFPYDAEDTAATAAALRRLEGCQVTGRDLLGMDVTQKPTDLSIIRRAEMESLFETDADKAGRDIDISRYIRGDEKLDVQVAWVDTSAYEEDARSVPVPPEPLRCAVKATDVAAFVARDPRPKVLVFSTTDDRWVRVAKPNQIKPQQILLIECGDGGYDLELGFMPSSRAPVALQVLSPLEVPDTDSVSSDPGGHGEAWLPLVTHLEEARHQAELLVSEISQDMSLDPEMSAAVIGAAALHDIGKAHPIWQEALLGTSENHPEAGVYAKSPGGGARRGTWLCKDPTGHRRPSFRHELVSALMLLTTDGEKAMLGAGVPEEAYDLCRYLVAAHHGHIRINPQDPTVEGRSGAFLFGLAQGDVVPGLGGDDTTADLAAVFGGGPGSWTDRSLGLLEQWGPFRLAYAEMLVRMADWRASALSHPEVVL